MKWMKLLPAVLALMLCCGCSTRELEDRSFPLAIGIDKNEEGMILSFDFPDLSESSDGKNPSGIPVSFSVEAGAYYEAQKAFENNTNKVLDYNHLKAVILSQEFLSDGEAVRELFSWLEQEEVLARNTYLFVAKESSAKILTLTENTDGSVGKYLEQMVDTQEDFRESKIATIGELMNQWHNQNELLLIPVLTDNGGVPSITEYAAVDAFHYIGNISVEDAMKAFLCQGELRQFLYRLSSGEVLEIRGIRTDMKIVAEDDAAVVTVKLSGQAQSKKAGSRNLSNRQLEQAVNQQLTESLMLGSARLLMDPGIDVSNSFIRLGGYQRTLYGQYGRDKAAYQEHLNLQFEVDIKIVNE